MSLSVNKQKAPRNRTITLESGEVDFLKNQLCMLDGMVSIDNIENKIIHHDSFVALDYLPSSFIDLMFADPPYNLNKQFNSTGFKAMKNVDYETWLDSWMQKIIRLLKPNASIYICGDWQSSAAIFNVASRYFKIRNRITFEREKGRGAKSNWKNCSEDIWFCTMSDDYYFDVDAVKMKRKVIAPYKDSNQKPKDWCEEKGEKYRLTYPSNIWSDITIPFWSMPENTEHPTQKPEKLCAKIILASSKPGDIVFDPFLGSGTTAVVAKKLNRRFSGIEIDETYCCIAQKRLNLAENNSSIQGYNEGVFWERNTNPEQSNKKIKSDENKQENVINLFQKELA